MTNQNLNMGQTATVTITPVDGQGFPGLLSTNLPLWHGPDASTGITVTTHADGMGAEISIASNAPPGTSTVSVQGQNPTAATFTSAFSIVVNEDNATAFNFTIVAH